MMSTCKRIAAVIGVGLLFATAPGRGADGERAAAFLLDNFAARPAGMGNASTAAMNDITALNANPAGLASIDNQEILIGADSNQSRDLRQTLAYAFPIRRRSTVAIGVSALKTSADPGMLRLTNRNVFQTYGEPWREDDLMCQIAWGRFVRPSFSFGLTAKYLNYRASSPQFLPEKYRGLYADVGLRYSSPISGLVFGASFQNLGMRLKGLSAVHQPWLASAGISYGHMFRSAHYLHFSCDLVKPRDHGLTARAGMEYWLANFFALRAGYDGVEAGRAFRPPRSAWRAGASLSIFSAVLDAMVIPHGGKGSYEVAVDLRFSFGEGRKRK